MKLWIVEGDQELGLLYFHTVKHLCKQIVICLSTNFVDPNVDDIIILGRASGNVDAARFRLITQVHLESKSFQGASADEGVAVLSLDDLRSAVELHIAALSSEKAA